MAVGRLEAVLTANTAGFDGPMLKSGEVVTATSRAIEQAAKKGQAAQELAAKLSTEAVNKEALAVVAARRRETEASGDYFKALANLKNGHIGDAEGAQAAAAAYQKLSAAKSEAAAAARAFEGNSRAAAAGSEALAVATEHVVPQMSAASAAVRGLEGNLTTNVRAAERFLTTTLNLGGVLSKAFPIIGAVALGSAIFEMGKKAYEATQNIVRLRGAAESLNNLQITVDKKTSGVGDAVEEQVEKAIEARAGKTAALQAKYAYQQKKPVDLSEYFYSSEFKGLPDDVKANYESTYKSIAPADLPGKLSKITSEVRQLQQALQTVRTPGATAGGFVPKVDGVGPALTRNPADYYSTRLLAAQQIQAQVQGQANLFGAKGQGLQDDIAKQQKEDADESARVAEEAGRKREAAIRKAGEAQYRAMEDQLSALRAVQDVSKLQEFNFWESMLEPARRFPENFSKVQEKVGNLYQELGREINQILEKGVADRKRQAEAIASADRTLLEIDNQAARAQHRDADALAQLYAVNQKNADLLEQQAIAQGVATGALTKHDAAIQLAALHASTYAAQLAALDKENQADRDDSSLSDDQRKANRDQRNVRAAQVNGEAARVAAQDQGAIQLSTGLGGARAALEDFIARTRDASAEMKSLTSDALGRLNSAILNGGGFREAGVGIARSAAGTLLNKAEGSVLSAFGLGSNTPKGTAADPLHVVSVGFGKSGLAGSYLPDGLDVKTLGSLLFHGSQAASKSNGVSGIFSTLLHALPGFANGGGIGANTLAIVGEKGPELFMPSTSGTIVPNNKMGMGDSHTWNIDARGSTDPAQVRAQVMQGIHEAMPSITRSTLTAQAELTRRTPSRLR